MGGKNKQRTKGNVRVGTSFSKRSFIQDLWENGKLI